MTSTRPTLTVTRSFRTTIHQTLTIDLTKYDQDEADVIWRHLTGEKTDDHDRFDIDDLILDKSDSDAPEEWDWIDDPTYTLDSRTISGPIRD
jgi:hypothetical protein